MTTAISSGVPAQNIRAMDRVSQEQLYSPGAYTIQEIMAFSEPPRKKQSFLGFLTKLVVGAAVIGGMAIGARKYIPALSKTSIDVAKGLETDAKLLDKVKYYFAKYTDKLDEITVTKLSKWIKERSKDKPKVDEKTLDAQA